MCRSHDQMVLRTKTNQRMAMLFAFLFRSVASPTIKKCRDFKLFPQRLFIVYCLLSVCLALPAFAVGAKEQQLKVSYIYNFAKFIKWPEPADTAASFTICVVGKQPLSGYIDLLQGKLVNDRSIQVKLIPKPEVGNCNILFIGDTEAQRLPNILEDIAALPVLSISDLPDFVHAGGIIGMKVMDDRVRFDINLAAAQKVGLNIDSQLLKLATEVLQ